MLRSNRMAVRLIRWLVITQIGSVVTGMAGWMLLSPYVTYEDVAAETARRLVAESLVIGPANVAIRPNADLQAYASTRPDLTYAVVAGGRITEGSSKTLDRYLSALGPSIPANGRLNVPTQRDRGRIILEEKTIDGRSVVVATAGNRFGWDDIPSLVTIYFRSVLIIFAPAVLTALLVIPVVVGRALRPLRRAGRDAATIGYDTLDRRLPVRGLTREVLPFVEAINSLLQRLSDGVARQRRFTADAAHELRTPSAILQARLASLPPFEGKRELERDARRISILADQLLAAARLTNTDAVPRTRVSLDELAREVVADCAPLALRSGRSVAFAGAPAAVHADPQAIVSAVTNLVDNAIRAEPPGGTIEVSTGTSAATGAAWVEVTDHGAGVGEADREAVFEPFWRKGAPGAGAGLGLAIVREIAEAHGGFAEHEMREGIGTTFRITMPSADASRPPRDR